ncbi:elongation of very long chain fatty acids protein 7-like [Clupea harengus]|uniref:Elongation of very long chain fatty acids protein n=1 Tax=Clupea harengus TaxID=7950 RepID=A0A8M1KEL8_CLUHA|nr:elongation of very long chain fatty acids protein 7-like [Clupea harengus]XP_042562496.1 elongation of very long chain fatty acids protein 7-like [Clupea harengus]
MAFNEFTSRAVHLYDEFLKKGDPRVDGWFLMDSPLPQAVFLISYIYFVTSLGPRLMENRKAFTLRPILIVYNFSSVALSLYMCYEFVMSGWGTGYSFQCDLVDYSHSPQAMRVRYTPRNQGTVMDLKRFTCIVAPAVPYQGTSTVPLS